MMPAAAYRESLRRLSPRIFVDGRKVESVADDPAFAPGINAVGVAYDFAHVPEHAALMTARQATSDKVVNRMLHVNETSTDLLSKLEAVRLVCRESGCAQRYIAHDMFNALFQATRRAHPNPRTPHPHPPPPSLPPPPGPHTPTPPPPPHPPDH